MSHLLTRAGKTGFYHSDVYLLMLRGFFIFSGCKLNSMKVMDHNNMRVVSLHIALCMMIRLIFDRQLTNVFV